MQLADLRVQVMEDGILSVCFVGVNGSPLVSGICIKKAPKALGLYHDSTFYLSLLKVPSLLQILTSSETFLMCQGLREVQDYIKCENCSVEIEIPKHQVV